MSDVERVDRDKAEAMAQLESLVGRLRAYNAWRRGEFVEQPHPQQIGADIDAAVTLLSGLLHGVRAAWEAPQAETRVNIPGDAR